jgi:cytoskeletal protein RodZ
MPAALGRRMGFQLLSWTQDTTVTLPQALPEPRPKRKHSLLPLLIVLFLVSYGLMALLTVEQDRTIASQRALITSLFSDSTELSSLKGKIVNKKNAQAQAQAEAGTRSQAQTPSTQTPLTQDTPGGTAQSSHNTGKLRKPVPPRPPLGIADIVDGRRIVKTI